MDTFVKRLGVAATVGMFIVLLMGATVTNTGSAEGCGRSWPLCHGQFIPEYAVETLIEFSHRLVTSIEGLLLLGFGVLAWRRRRGLPELTLLVPLTLFTLVLQSGMGAAAVMWPQTPFVMALHMGISLIAFASVFLATRVLYEGPDRPPRSLAAVPLSYRRVTLFTLGWIIIVTYVGAYMRHSGADLGCYTWPLCNGQVIPSLSGAEGIAFAHRLAALLAVALMIWRWLQSRRFAVARPDLLRTDRIALALILIQSLVGGFVVLSRLSLASAMLHAGVMALLFAAVADVARRVLPQPEPQPTASEPRPAGRVGPAPAAD
ncbi:MAG: heme A synthase [Thermomicrobiales bacterium]|nr:heme A synthase [Thermomicrobiales bacterium]